MTDIIDLIDQVTAPTCGSCANPLRADGPSPDFCGEVCAEAWNAGRTPSLLDRVPQGFVSRPIRFLNDAPPPAYVDGPWHARFSSEQPNFLPTTPLPGFRMELTDGRTWPAWTPSPNTVAVTPLDPGAPWLRSPITPPPTRSAVFIGGQRHGQTMAVPNPPRHTLEIIEAAETVDMFGPSQGLFNSELVQAQRVVYRLMCHNGAHWCYVDPRPAAPQRTVHVEGHEPLTVDYHHHDAQRDTWWVTITGRNRGVVWELPGELLADDAAQSAWFAERSRDGGLPSFRPMPGPWTSPDGRLTITCERRRGHHILRVFDGQHVTVHPFASPLDQIPLVLHEVCRLHELDRRRADAGYPDPRYPGMRFTVDGSWDVTDQRPPWQQSAIRDALLAAITRIREALLPEPRTIELTREQWETMRSQEPSMRGLVRGPLPGDQVFGRQIVMVDRHEDSTIGQGQAARPYRDMRHCP